MKNNYFENQSKRQKRTQASRLHHDKIMAPILKKFREDAASLKNPTCETNIDSAMATDMGSGQKLWKEEGKNEKKRCSYY
jgi:hypothetical protein